MLKKQFDPGPFNSFKRMIKNVPIGSMIQRSLDTGKFKLDFILNFFLQTCWYLHW